MIKGYGNFSDEEAVIDYLRKNKNFFIKYPELTKQLNFSLKDSGSDKIVDLNTYRYKKISQENIDLQNQMTEILIDRKNHITTQKKILKLSLRILNAKNFDKIINVILVDFKTLLSCDFINCFSTDNSTNTNDVQKIDTKIINNYFNNKSMTNLNQNPKGVLLYFPNKSKIVKSYILLKININKKLLIIAIGSKDNKKFSPNQQVDLVEYLIKIIEIKLHNVRWGYEGL